MRKTKYPVLLILLLLVTAVACESGSDPGAADGSSATVVPPVGTQTAPTSLLTTTATTTSASPTPSPVPASGTYQLVEGYPDLTFDQPLYFTVADDGRQEAYVVERTGRILVFDDHPETTETRVFLDLRDRINLDGQEKGVLGLAFHPSFRQNGYFYVYYTSETASHIARFTRPGEESGAADPDSELILMSYEQPYSNHNGGHLDFGPDGYLYIASGDGGSGGDPQNNAQNRSSPLGKILRIDVNGRSGERNYAIPPDNPFAGNDDGGLEEIFAYGLRNPWRFSFDEQGVLWAADVGQSDREEINRIERGGNYGWNYLEGTREYREAAADMDPDTFIAPVWEYDHDQGRSITGGYVVAGNRMPSLKGTYVYGDYISGRIWALWTDGQDQIHNQLILETDLNIASFGVDADGELKIVDFSGSIYELHEE